jgi:hypothetical protein
MADAEYGVGLVAGDRVQIVLASVSLRVFVFALSAYFVFAPGFRGTLRLRLR